MKANLKRKLVIARELAADGRRSLSRTSTRTGTMAPELTIDQALRRWKAQ